MTGKAVEARSREGEEAAFSGDLADGFANPRLLHVQDPSNKGKTNLPGSHLESSGR